MDEIVIVGTNGTPDAVAAVEGGDLDLTIQLCGFRQGTRAVEALAEFVENGTAPGGPTRAGADHARERPEKKVELAKGCTGPAA